MINLTSLIKEFKKIKTYKFFCKLTVDTEKINIADVLSNVRAVEGVTIVSLVESKKLDLGNGKRYSVSLSIKVNSSPFENLDKEKFKEMLENIRKLPYIYNVKFTTNPILVKK
jgi:hypothetical protein